MDKVLITGGTGFCGRWMADTSPKMMDIWVLNHKNYSKMPVLADQNFDEQYTFKYVVHLAPVSPLNCLKLFPKARHLYVSSGAIYDQKTQYADNKRAWELECQGSRTNFVIARPFTFIGYGLRGMNFAAKNFIQAAIRGDPMLVYGDGSTIRSYLHGSDLGRWLWTILLNGEQGHAYDVGSGIPVTILELAQEVAKVKPTRIHILNNEYTETRYLPKVLSPTWRLGCSQTYDLRESIEMTMKEMMNEPS